MVTIFNKAMSSSDKQKLDRLPLDANTADVQYDSVSKKITKTINGTTSDVVTATTLKNDMLLIPLDVHLENVDNTSDLNKPVSTATQAALNNKLDTSVKGQALGVAELDENGHVPATQLPSYVDDVLEFTNRGMFPVSGESGKIYVDLDTNKTFRWGGSEYFEISASLALGTTSSTAFRGDYGDDAYQHALAKGAAFESGLYKITTNSEGHVTNTSPVQKSDITSLGIPSENITYSLALDQENDHILKLNGSDGISSQVILPDTTYSFIDSDTTLAWGTRSTIATTGGVDLHVSLPQNPNTDTSVTAAANHYTPIPDAESAIVANADGATAAWGIDVVTGLTVDTDGKGHVTNVSVSSGKLPSLGTTAGTAAEGDHVHITSIASSVAVSQLNLQPSSKYEISAGGTNFVFTTPTDTTYTALTDAEIDAIFA